MENTNRKSSNKLLGRIFIWAGTLTWIIYIVMVKNGKDISIWPFLIAYLAGRFGGTKLIGSPEDDGEVIGLRRRKLSKVLIFLGVLAWLPYIYLDNVIGAEVNITPFLAVHLGGIISGILVRLSVSYRKTQEVKKVKEKAVTTI